MPGIGAVTRAFEVIRALEKTISQGVRIRVQNTKPSSVHALILTQARYECVKIASIFTGLAPLR